MTCGQKVCGGKFLQHHNLKRWASIDVCWVGWVGTWGLYRPSKNLVPSKSNLAYFPVPNINNNFLKRKCPFVLVTFFRRQKNSTGTVHKDPSRTTSNTIVSSCSHSDVRALHFTRYVPSPHYTCSVCFSQSCCWTLLTGACSVKHVWELMWPPALTPLLCPTTFSCALKAEEEENKQRNKLLQTRRAYYVGLSSTNKTAASQKSVVERMRLDVNAFHSSLAQSLTELVSYKFYEVNLIACYPSRIIRQIHALLQPSERNTKTRE